MEDGKVASYFPSPSFDGNTEQLLQVLTVTPGRPQRKQQRLIGLGQEDLR